MLHDLTYMWPLTRSNKNVISCVGVVSDTSALSVIRFCHELADFVRGDGKRNACRHFQRVDANHLAILKQQISI